MIGSRPGALRKRMDSVYTDEAFMRAALEHAREAAARGEVPVGAVVVIDGTIVAAAANRTRTDVDPTAHAEIVALREAAEAAGNYRLPGATLYVTLEPCAMCAGAMVAARITRLVYGTPDPKAGAAGTLYDIPRDARLNHRIDVRSGVLAGASSVLLKEFFEGRRG